MFIFKLVRAFKEIFRGYSKESDRFEVLAMNFANRFGPLKFQESTYLEDFSALASSMNTVIKNGRQEIQSRTELAPDFSLRIIDQQTNSLGLETAVELNSLSNAIWFDFLINGTQGYRQCEYINIFDDRRKGCSAWMSVLRRDQKWCSDACRMGAKRRLHKISKK